ncbi:MAG: hypothetical protein RIB59_07710, partial [Rhodospirillales bacterium]
MIRFRAFLIPALFALAFLIVGDAQAADALKQGPKVGEAIPHQLTATDQNGQQRNFGSLKRERGLILLFTRSLD